MMGADPIDEELTATLVDELPRAAIVGALIFGLLALAEALFVAAPAVYPVVALSSSTSVALATLAWHAREGNLAPAHVRPAIAAGLGLSLLNAIGLAAIRPYPEATFAFALVALAGGLLLYSPRWLAGLLVADAIAWIGVALLAPVAPGWIWWAPFVLLASFGIALVTQGIRRRHHQALRDRDQRIEELEREIREVRETADDVRRGRSQLLADISHEVRTPACAIIGRAHDLRAGDVDPEQAEDLASIEGTARHLVRLFDDIMDIALAETGELSVEEEACQLERVLHQSLDMVSQQARDEGLDLTSSVADDVPEVVRLDPHRLQQVLGNLLSNAVKFTDEGSVEVRASRQQADPLVLRFEVEDTGIGIPEEGRETLFTPFGQLEGSPEREGTGLGLAICRRIVEMLGGEIDVASTPGEGSTFAFTLPAEEADPTQITAGGEGVRLSGREAWMVGSEGFPAPPLERWGISVETMAGTGVVEEALETGRRPALIVLDLLSLEAPEAFLAQRVRAWRDRGIPVLISKEPGHVLGDLADTAGPGRVFTPSIPEKKLHEAVTASLREGGSGAPDVDTELGQRHPLSILVVEDSPVNRRLIASLIDRLGYEPDAAGSAEEALELVQDARYDLVFVDLGLPGFQGDELARRIHEHQGDGPRLVALTGHTDEDTRQQAEAAGIDAYLAKPAEAEDVVAQIEMTPKRSAD
jgi:signal transduction histidine kinase/CheY-like chemotaxis protein